MPAAMTTAAACNHVSISCPNSSAPQSLWPAFFVRADGVTTGRLRRNVPGVLVAAPGTRCVRFLAHWAWADSSTGGPAVKALRNSVTASLGGRA